jgi:hypothetical protein
LKRLRVRGWRCRVFHHQRIGSEQEGRLQGVAETRLRQLLVSTVPKTGRPFCIEEGSAWLVDARTENEKPKIKSSKIRKQTATILKVFVEGSRAYMYFFPSSLLA